MSKAEGTTAGVDASTTGSIRSSLHATSISIIGLFTIAVIAAVYLLKPVLLPVVLAMLLAAALEPIVDRLRGIGLPRTVIAAMILGCFVIAVVLAVWNFASPVSRWVSSVPAQIDRVESAWRDLRVSMDEVTKVAEQVDDLAAEGEDAYRPTVVIEKQKLSEIVFTSMRNALGTFFLTVVILYFLIGYGHEIGDKVRAYLGIDLIGDITQSISSYLFSITMINAGLGIAVGFAMWVIGMPNPVIWGVLAFVLNFLPYLGGIIGICLVAFVAILTFDTLSWRIVPPATYLVLTASEGYFVTPTVLGRRFPINPLVLVTCIIFSAWLWGVPGALLAVPLLMAFRLTCAHFPRLEFIGELIGDLPRGIRTTKKPESPQSEQRPDAIDQTDSKFST